MANYKDPKIYKSDADKYREELAYDVWFEYYTNGKGTKLFALLAEEQDRVGYYVKKEN
jgi:hypothetical protein